MQRQATIVCVIGTRPEAIKMAPVIRQLAGQPWARCVVVATAQHRSLLDQMLARLEIEVHHDLDLMEEAQSASNLLSRMLPRLDAVFREEGADAVLAQGDTTSVLGAALAAFHLKLPFGHVEAGLRTFDVNRPFPEEGYRQMVARVARWHFAPTNVAKNALQSEGIRDESIFVTGNTGIDSLLHAVASMEAVPKSDSRTILLTVHRRESFGYPLLSVMRGVRRLVQKYSDLQLIYPVHPNPNVRDMARDVLGGHERIHLVNPMDYFSFVQAMRASTLIITDSGGIQEEAPALGKPVLVVRECTERPEAVAQGSSLLVGTEQGKIIEAASALLDSPQALARFSRGVSPYGDGAAAQRIVKVLKEWFQTARQ